MITALRRTLVSFCMWERLKGQVTTAGPLDWCLASDTTAHVCLNLGPALSTSPLIAPMGSSSSCSPSSEFFLIQLLVNAIPFNILRFLTNIHWALRDKRMGQCRICSWLTQWVQASMVRQEKGFTGRLCSPNPRSLLVYPFSSKGTWHSVIRNIIHSQKMWW